MLSKSIDTVVTRGVATIADWLAAYVAADENRTLNNDLYIPKKKTLMDIYDHTLLDNHLSAAIKQRKDRIMEERFTVVNSETEGEAGIDTQATEVVNMPWFYQMIDHILDAEFYGYSLLEFETGYGTREIEKVNVVPRRNTIPEKSLVLKRPSDNTGIDYTRGRYRDSYHMIHRGHGLLLKAAPVAIYKRYAMGAWTQGAEGFGMPFIMVKTGEEDQNAKGRLLDDMMKTRRNRIAIAGLMDEMEVSQMGHTDAHKIYDGLVERCNSEMSKLVLGATLTVDGGASYSQSNVHEKVVDRSANADRRLLMNTVNYEIFPKLVRLGYTQLEGKQFKIWNVPMPTYAEKIEAFKILANHYEIDQEEIENQIGIKVGDRLMRPVNQYSGGKVSERETNTSPKTSEES